MSVFIITTHAIERYQERIRHLPSQEAEEFLLMVCSESVPAPKSVKRKVRNMTDLNVPGFSYRYHHGHSLFLVLDQDQRLVTVWPVV